MASFSNTSFLEDAFDTGAFWLEDNISFSSDAFLRDDAFDSNAFSLDTPVAPSGGGSVLLDLGRRHARERRTAVGFVSHAPTPEELEEFNTLMGIKSPRMRRRDDELALLAILIESL